MGRTGNGWIAAVVLATLLSAPQSPLGAEGAAETAVTSQEAVPNPAEVMTLSLEESILLGLKNNLDIAIEGFNPKIRETDVTSAKAVFDPAAFAEVTFAKDKAQNRSRLATNPVTDNEDLNAGVGVRQDLPTGANYELRFDNHRNNTNTSFLESLNPAYDSALSLVLTQPLLKNFGVDVNRTQIKIAQNEREISLDQFRQTMMGVITQVQTAYWDLVFALENLKVQQRSLQLAKELAELNRARVRAGVAAPVEITQAEAEVAARERDVIAAEKGVRDAEDQLKVVLNMPKQGEWGGAILPTDPAKFSAVVPDLPGAVADALRKRPEYQAAKVDLSNRELNLRFARNQLLPDLALTGSVGVQGLGGNYGNDLDNLSSGDFYQASVGIALTVPIGNRAARSQFVKAQLERNQTQVSLQKLEVQITAEVREAVRRVETASKQVEATKAGRVLAEEQLRIERKRLEAGVSTTFEVLRLQRDLTAAQANEVQALTDFNKSLANLDQARGVALEKHRIQM